MLIIPFLLHSFWAAFLSCVTVHFLGLAFYHERNTELLTDLWLINALCCLSLPRTPVIKRFSLQNWFVYGLCAEYNNTTPHITIGEASHLHDTGDLLLCRSVLTDIGEWQVCGENHEETTNGSISGPAGSRFRFEVVRSLPAVRKHHDQGAHFSNSFRLPGAIGAWLHSCTSRALEKQLQTLFAGEGCSFPRERTTH